METFGDELMKMLFECTCGLIEIAEWGGENPICPDCGIEMRESMWEDYNSDDE